MYQLSAYDSVVYLAPSSKQNLLLILRKLPQFLLSEKPAFQYELYVLAHFSVFQEQLFLTHGSGQNILDTFSSFGKIPYLQKHPTC